MKDYNDLKPKERRANRLSNEKSPYLLQHAFNPVDWYAWREEAFERARKDNKPIFLSIGYSTCHWCHVMEKESFEDAEIAGLMNEAFVSIKVDREERPDLDHIYMSVCQMMTGSGGWPLTILMTPEKEPFFAATYLPKSNRFGRHGLMDLIPRVKQLWENRNADVLESAANFTQALQKLEKGYHVEELDYGTLQSAFEDLSKHFDKTYGGFSDAPKFPTPHNFSFLLRYWKRTGNVDALKMVEKTLQELRWGGIFDQIGYGFHRYSTDKEWLVPHFEKMLYDQAMLAIAYIEIYQATGNAIYSNTAREIFAYVLRDMRSPEGAFYSAEDADSEGIEGKYYLWTEEEVREILSKEEADLVIHAFHVEKKGNFKEEGTGKIACANILYLGKTPAEIGAELLVPDAEKIIDVARGKLFEAREQRIHPYKDDKILADWNGLMIAAFAKVAQVLGEEQYILAASEAARFVIGKMRTPEGRLLHRYREGDADITASIDDYAFFIWGLIELYEADFDALHLKTAMNLSKDLLDHYYDPNRGGFFFTPDDGESLIVRKKEIYDGAIPSGNAVAMLNFLRLARLTGRTEYEEKAVGVMKAFSSQVKHFPSASTQFLCSFDFALGPSFEVVLAGPSAGNGVLRMLNALRSRFLPNHVVLLRPSDKDSSDIDGVAGFVRNHAPIDGKATAYVCLDKACRTPTTNVDEMLAFLDSSYFLGPSLGLASETSPG
ncbi:MAG: thioredoxin domain-containing protein [Deltaproteobacteria bacterium]|nr:thioredoxin domain-containing protein [Deltaproteobacteria bacterium]